MPIVHKGYKPTYNWGHHPVDMRGSINGKYTPSSLDGLFYGKSEHEMDDEQGYPILGNFHISSYIHS